MAGLKGCQRLMGRIRKCIKILRTPNCRAFLKQLQLPIPTLDMPTRWSSIYRMVKCFLKFKEPMADMKASRNSRLYNLPTFTESQWTGVEELMKILELAHIMTQTLQRDGLTSGECLHQGCKLNMVYYRKPLTKIAFLFLVIRKIIHILFQLIKK